MIIRFEFTGVFYSRKGGRQGNQANIILYIPENPISHPQNINEIVIVAVI